MKGEDMSCQTEFDVEAMERLNEDIRRHEEDIHSQKLLFENRLNEMKRKEQLSNEEVKLKFMIFS